jgi:hypothetical protein
MQGRPPAEFRFNPPLQLSDGGVLRTLDEAAAFARAYANPRLPKIRQNMLRCIDRVADERGVHLQGRAADLFRNWAYSEGLLPKQA